jgi:hypothetical protein
MKSLLLLLGIVLASLATTAILWWLGQPWGGDHYSHRWIDRWAWSHFGHGIVFCAIAKSIWPKGSVLWLLLVVALVECGWEILENTPVVIQWFRDRGDVAYGGDSLRN